MCLDSLLNEHPIFREPIEFIFGKKKDYEFIHRYTIYGLEGDNPRNKIYTITSGLWDPYTKLFIEFVENGKTIGVSMDVYLDKVDPDSSLTSDWFTAVYGYGLKHDILGENTVRTYDGVRGKLEHWKAYHAVVYALRHLDYELISKALNVVPVEMLLDVCDEENLMEAKMMVLRVNHEAGKIHDAIFEL